MVETSVVERPSHVDRRRRRWLWPVVVVVAVVAGAAGWAVATVLRPAADPTTATQYTNATVKTGEVGSSITLNAVASWASRPAASNGASGVVTTVDVKPGASVKAGAVLYTVDLRPTIAAQGAVPAFRSIAAGDRGKDVAQVQRMLSDLGFYRGDADGEAGAGTIAAVKAWQKSTGVTIDGIVRRGDVVFFPKLPARVVLDTEIIARGKTLAGGEDAVRVLPDAPTFTIPATAAQAAMMPEGTPVQISAPKGGTWDAATKSQKTDQGSGTVNIVLAPTGKSAICADACDLIPVTGDTLLASRIITMPTATGLVVPASALITDAGGRTALIDTSGRRHPVTVKATAQGMSVVEGVDAGFQARVPATMEK